MTNTPVEKRRFDKYESIVGPGSLFWVINETGDDLSKREYR
jgi:hypothetical protein